MWLSLRFLKWQMSGVVELYFIFFPTLFIATHIQCTVGSKLGERRMLEMWTQSTSEENELNNVNTGHYDRRETPEKITQDSFDVSVRKSRRYSAQRPTVQRTQSQSQMSVDQTVGTSITSGELIKPNGITSGEPLKAPSDRQCSNRRVVNECATQCGEEEGVAMESGRSVKRNPQKEPLECTQDDEYVPNSKTYGTSKSHLGSSM
ncbi:unnamed protein product [Nippostrongylus brasiliensis]|uniref:Uncharacterized protein n=1 Tax=Nippostrongylus brasiliensis TaxID=27835 RepID=A0A0N4XI25_NIPBR|nr:unnamed protein product [Nippostrongylus brasiliensis]